MNNKIINASVEKHLKSLNEPGLRLKGAGLDFDLALSEKAWLFSGLANHKSTHYSQSLITLKFVSTLSRRVLG